MVRGSTPRSRAVWVRLPLLRSSDLEHVLALELLLRLLEREDGGLARRRRGRDPRATRSVWSQRTSAFLMRFSSWRMLPGHGYFLIAASAGGREALDRAVELVGVLGEERLGDDEHVVAALAERREPEVDDVEAVVEVLAEAARRGSRPRGSGWSRRRRGCRPSRACESPTRKTTRSCSARRSFTWRFSGSSPISSRKSVPLSADLELAGAADATAPVKAPFTWPKSSLSIRFSGMAPQLMATNGPPSRGCCGGGARCAMSSLPVPVSPVMRTLMSVVGDLLELAEHLHHRRAGADDLAEPLVLAARR